MADTESTRDSGPAGDDLASVLSAAYEEHEAENAADAPASGKNGEVADATSSGRARDVNGRFIKSGEGEEADGAQPAGDDKSDPAAEAETSKEKPGAAEEGDAAKLGEQPQGVEPPSNWSAADKARLTELEKLSPDHAKWLLDRHKGMEADYTKKTQAIAEFRKEYEPIDAVLKPWEQRIRAAGFTKSGLIQAWAAVEKELAEGRGINVVRGIVQQYKLSVAEVAKALGLATGALTPGEAKPDAGAGAAAPAEIPAALQPLIKEIEALRTWKQGVETNQRTAAEQRRSAELTRITNDIETFRTAKDEKSGALKAPFFEEVERDMARLAQLARANGQRPTLQELYESAVWANPSTRAKQLAANDEAQREKAQGEARAKAANARRAGASVTGAPAAGQTPRKPAKDLSLREQLETAFDDQSE